MVVITIDLVLKIYKSLLDGTLSFDEADRWAWSMIQENDLARLQYHPAKDEDLIWDLIYNLYGIDDIMEMSTPERTKMGIIEFLLNNGIDTSSMLIP